MADIANLPNVVGVGMLAVMGLIWRDIRGFKKDFDVKLQVKLDEPTHNLLCKVATLEIKQHIDIKLDEAAKLRSIEMGKLKDDLLDAMHKNGVVK